MQIFLRLMKRILGIISMVSLIKHEKQIIIGFENLILIL